MSVLYMHLLGQGFTIVHFIGYGSWSSWQESEGEWQDASEIIWKIAKGGNFRMKIRDRRKIAVSKITIKKSEKVIRSHIINYLFKQTLQYT